MNSSVSPARIYLERLFARLGMGMRAKLIILFVIIKVLPLVLVALLAWRQAALLGDELRQRTSELTEIANAALTRTGDIAVSDAVKALDDRATEDIERMTTDTALRVADFLYSRDDDILFAADLAPDQHLYQEFINTRIGRLVKQSQWELAPDGKSWQPAAPPPDRPVIGSSIKENELSFRYRPPESFQYEIRPLYLEMTFVDLNGQERVKTVTSPEFDPALKDISKRENTFVKAETYFDELKKLKPGEIYVSDVIGAYVPSRVIGKYTPEKAAQLGIEFAPEKEAYAGMENPLGKRFKGIVRWATPVVKDDRVIGYVTLALDHDHIMEFTSHLMPTFQRYTEIPDAFEGNYAFIWDHKGRSIVHPRHHSIVGYDPATGDPQVPWLEDVIYDAWRLSGQSYAEFIPSVPTFVEQSNTKKPAAALTKSGLVGLDCRYLNFAPQCTGWFDLTREGGSGSFVILWSGLKKLTTAAAIPYYTGQYAASPRGFGFVTIGAGVDDFHRPATGTKKVIDDLIAQINTDLDAAAEETQRAINANLLDTAKNLTLSTAIMSLLVILVAIWLASSFTRSITGLINGISRFRSGERHFRFRTPIKDEMGALADSFDEMADSLVGSVSGPMVITDLDGKILYMNEIMLAMLGKKLPEVLGQPYAENALFPPNSVYSPISALLDNREAEVMFHEPSKRYFRGSASYLTDKTGRAIGYIITATDLTEIVEQQEKVNEQRALLDTIFSSSPDIMWYKDREGRYLAVNPRFASLVNKTPNELSGRRAEELFSPERAREINGFDEQTMHLSSALYSEERLRFADGHVEVVDMLRTPLFDAAGELIGILGVGRDVSGRAAVENELREMQQELEKAVTEANRANAFKSEFLARMSHEIRTPMNAIIGMTNIAMRKVAESGEHTGEIQSHLRQIEVSSQHLLGLLNDILDISKIEAGKIVLGHEPFDLTRLVESVATIIRHRCTEKNITFRVSLENFDHSSYVSDSLRLRQVLINLLGNAVKFTHECGWIDFKVTLAERDQTRDRIVFSVADNGIGMDEAVMANLFKPFEQGSGHITRKYGGTGLGLSISQSIVKLLGSHIEAQSQLGQGSVFSFSIWLEKGEDIGGAESASTDLSLLRGRRILLVDDVEINRIIVIELLRGSGLLIDEAGDGQIALDKFRESPENYYDAILMDIQMPNMDGYQSARAIRALDRLDARSLAIIAMTANAFKDDVDEAMASGMNSHLSKPLEYDRLVEELLRFLGRSER